jgi:hypothetical protein
MSSPAPAPISTTNDTVCIVELTQGRQTIVSPEDFDLVAQHRWYGFFNTTSKRWYAYADIKNADGKAERVYMHRLIMNAPRGLDVDHANGNSLDNRRSNLRLASRSQNQANRPAPRNNQTGFKGVQRGRSGRYIARIQQCGKVKHIGTFTSKVEAAKAYDQHARVLYGVFAFTNFPTEQPQTQAVA